MSILEETTDVENNPAQTLTVDVLDAAERVLKAMIVEDGADLPEGWEVDDVRFLLEQLEQGKMVLVADRRLGIPTIHDFTGVRHCGMGVMMVEQPEYTVLFDAGASMERTPVSDKGWTSLAVREGSYDYPFEAVVQTLRSYGASEPFPDDDFGDAVHVLTFGDNGSQVYFEGDQYLVLNPYTDQDGQRYGSGWSWYFRGEIETGGEWRLLPDPDLEGCYVGDLSLSEAVLYAQRVEQVVFDLAGAPDDLPDKYPKPLYDKAQEVEAEESTHKAESKPKKRKLPDDIPDAIEVDLGHFKGWAMVTAERVKGRWLHYRLPDGQTGKVQVIGRDMLWRVPATATS